MADYIPALMAAESVKMSPARFANLLRKERERLPVEFLSNFADDKEGLLKKQVFLDMFYEGDEGKADPEAFLFKFGIHTYDWEDFITHMDNPNLLKQAQTRIVELEQELAVCRDTKQKEDVNSKSKTSYLSVIAALCNKSQRIDITASNTVSIIQAEIEKIGLKLGDDTIRKIIKEVRDMTNE